MAFANSSKLQNGYPSPGPQNPTGQKVMDHVFFLSNEEWKKAREENKYDLIIIGTGFCAYAVAHRALEKNPSCSILMVERGTFFLPEHFQNLPLPFVNTLGGLSETFPWTISYPTAKGNKQRIRFQHGMVPFVGGRSTLWSAWCPRPNKEEMDGWPKEIIRAANRNFSSAEKLLHVQKADKIDANLHKDIKGQLSRPVYGKLQKIIQERLEINSGDVEGIYRTEAAPLAAKAEDANGIDFQKYSVPGDLLQLIVDPASKLGNIHTAGEDSDIIKEKYKKLDVVANCTVEQIYQQDGRATALKTSRGVLPIDGAELVLAMGTLPPTTLVRNSFPQIAEKVGERFSAHFITSIIARIPKKDFVRSKNEEKLQKFAKLKRKEKFGELEIGACYIAGLSDSDYKKQYHIQLSILADEDPKKNAEMALRYIPDVVATATIEQLQSSKEYVVFVCAVLGELDYRNKDNFFKNNTQDNDITTNSLLQITENDADKETWSAMDIATFEILEKAISSKGASGVEYWDNSIADEKMDKENLKWTKKRPNDDAIRVDALVHESSTLHIGEDDSDPVDLNYRLRGTENVYITGGALWPQGGSWNPTMTMVALAQDLADKLNKKRAR